MSFITTNQPTFFKCFAVALLAALPGSWRLLVAGEGLLFDIVCGLTGLVACKRFRFSLTIGSLNSLAEDFADEMRLISIFKYAKFDENYRIQIAKFTSLSKAPVISRKNPLSAFRKNEKSPRAHWARTMIFFIFRSS